MTRIFLTLALFANLSLAGTFALGWVIDDPRSLEDAARDAVSLHFLVALGSSIIAMLVHAVALTYFMGTGRWIEETSAAYRLGEEARRRNIRLKYRVIPAMIGAIGLILATGSFGAIADPASRFDMASATTIHFLLAATTLLANGLASWLEYDSIRENGNVVSRVVDEVRAIRRAKGLDPQPVESAGGPSPV